MDFDNPYLSPRQRVLLRHEALKKIREPRIADWREMNDYILPRRLRYFVTDKTKVGRNTKIINGTATRAVRVLQSGMMAGMTSPARPWLRLISDQKVMQIAQARHWLGRATGKVLEAFARSNIYKCLPKFYGDLAVFGTAAMYVEQDPEDAVRGFVLPVGQYVIANDPRGKVNTISREFTMSVVNTVERFGWDNVSQAIKDAYKGRRFDDDVIIIHMVEPRLSRDPDRADVLNMPWRSVWMEKQAIDTQGFLRESGYNRFPFMVARWEVADDVDDPYGDGPGIEAVGEATALQLMERRKAQAIDKISNPPMAGPASLRPTAVSLVPGGYTSVDTMQGGQQFGPAVTVNAQAIREFEECIRTSELRLNKIFMADLWLMLASTDRREITAREVDERHEEKMIQLGPVVDRLNDELIDPLVETTVNALIINGELEPPPMELMAANIKVDNISIIGQAQKLVGTVGLERLAGFAGNIAAVDREILDNIDRDQLVRNYADMLGVSPDNLTDRERMEIERAARRRQAQLQAQAEMAPAMRDGAQAAKVLSETDVNGDNALTRLLGAVGAA